MPRLTWAIVHEIRALGPDNSLSYEEIGARFGIAGPRTADIIAGHGWKDPSYTPPKRKVRAKLDWPAVRLIRARYSAGETCKGLAAIFGVSHVAIHFIVTGHNWKNDPLGFTYEPVKRVRGVQPTPVSMPEPSLERAA